MWELIHYDITPAIDSWSFVFSIICIYFHSHPKYFNLFQLFYLFIQIKVNFHTNFNFSNGDSVDTIGKCNKCYTNVNCTHSWLYFAAAKIEIHDSLKLSILLCVLIRSCMNGFSSPFCHSRCYQYGPFSTESNKNCSNFGSLFCACIFGSMWYRIGKKFVQYTESQFEIDSSQHENFISFAMYVRKVKWIMNYVHSHSTIANHIATMFLRI